MREEATQVDLGIWRESSIFAILVNDAEEAEDLFNNSLAAEVVKLLAVEVVDPRSCIIYLWQVMSVHIGFPFKISFQHIYFVLHQP